MGITRKQSGFTLVELLIVIVIIAILAAITIVAYNGITNKAHTAVLQSDLSNGRTSLGIYSSSNGNYPADQATAVANGLKSSTGDTLTYTLNADGYCLQASGWSETYHVTDSISTPTSGSCSDANPPVEEGKTLAVTGSITDAGPTTGLVVSPDGSKLYVLTRWNGDVSVINTTTNDEEGYITLGVTPTDSSIAVSPDGQRLYVSDADSGLIYVINTATNTVITTISDSAGPCVMVISPDSSKMYVSDCGSDTVSVINTSSNTITATINVGNSPLYAVMNASGSAIYVLNNEDDTISAINTATNTVTATMTLDNNTYGFDGLGISHDNQKLYAVHYNDDGINLLLKIVNIATGTITDNVNVDHTPLALAVAPDGTKVYIYTNTATKKLTIMDTSDNSYTQVTLPGFSEQLVVSPDGSKIYVGDDDHNAVTVLTWQ